MFSHCDSESLQEPERGSAVGFLIWILNSYCIKEAQEEMNSPLSYTGWLWSLGPNIELLRVRNFSLESAAKCSFGTWHGAALVRITFVTPRLITKHTTWTKEALLLFRPCSKSPDPKLLSDPASRSKCREVCPVGSGRRGPSKSAITCKVLDHEGVRHPEWIYPSTTLLTVRFFPKDESEPMAH